LIENDDEDEKQESESENQNSNNKENEKKESRKMLRSAMAGLFLAAYCGSSGSSLDPVRLVPSSSL